MIDEQIEVNEKKSKVTFSFNNNELNAKQSNEKKSNLKKWKQNTQLISEVPEEYKQHETNEEKIQ